MPRPPVIRAITYSYHQPSTTALKMGWMWSNAPKQPPPKDEPQPQSSEPPQLFPHAQSESSPPLTNSQPRAPSRDEQAEAEFQNLLKEFSTATSEPSDATHLPFNASNSPSAPPSLINHSSIHPDNLYPTTMSCRAAFDSAFYCQSLGGQFLNVYRYGTIRQCSDQWSNFWFCMRTNRGMIGEEERKKRIRMHYMGRAGKYRSGPSSEDVWSVREERVEGAFEGDFEALEREMGGLL